MKFTAPGWLKNFGADDGADALASLIGAAQANPEFRQELLNLLKLPAQHRKAEWGQKSRMGSGFVVCGHAGARNWVKRLK